MRDSCTIEKNNESMEEIDTNNDDRRDSAIIEYQYNNVQYW